MTAPTPVRERAAPTPPPATAPATQPPHVTRQQRDAAQKAITLLEKVNSRVNQALLTIGFGALVFTCINVTRFGMDHGIPWWVAWLLDPLASLALITTLYVDGVLAEQGDYKATGWPLTLRWTAGLSTWLMNCWTSLYPTGKVTLVPHDPDPGGLLLHSVAPVLLIALAEGASGYRKTISARLAQHRRVLAAWDEQQHRERENRDREAREEREREAREKREEREREARRAENEAARQAEIEAKREAARIEREAREENLRLAEKEAKVAAERERERLRAEAEARAIETKAQAEAQIAKQRADEEAREKEERRRRAAARRASQSAHARASQSAAGASESDPGRPSENTAGASESDRAQPSENAGQASESDSARPSQSAAGASETPRLASVSALVPSDSDGRVPRTVREQQRQDAEEWVASLLADGAEEPTAAAVAARYGKGETWGGDRIRAVKQRRREEEAEREPTAAAN